MELASLSLARETAGTVKELWAAMGTDPLPGSAPGKSLFRGTDLLEEQLPSQTTGFGQPAVQLL